MVRKRRTQTLFIYMNGIQVGTLSRKTRGDLLFQYEQGWLQYSETRPISLSMPLTEKGYHGDVVTQFFENLLPDSDAIRNRLQARFSAPTKGCFDLLSFIGGDCVGALQLLTEPLEKLSSHIQAKPVSDKEISQLLKSYRTAPLGMSEDYDFRISIAGAQEKTALLWHNNRWQIPIRQTPTSHIIKLPIGYIEHAGMDLSDSVENEWLCMKILSAYGLNVAKAEIKYFDTQKTLVVERFDRRWIKNQKQLLRLPQEDFCQALGVPPGLKYEFDGGPGIDNIMQLLRGSNNAVEDCKHFMKTVLVFWVLGAIDGHAKNFSIHLLANSNYKLTPLYDVMSAYPLVAKHQLQKKRMKMAMAVKSKNRHYIWQDILPRHWLATAQRVQFAETDMRRIMDEIIEKTDDIIAKVSSQIPKGFDEMIAAQIFLGMQHVVGKMKRTMVK